LKTLKQAEANSKGKGDAGRMASEAAALQKQVDDAQRDLDDSTKECGEIDSNLKKVVEEAATKIKKLTKAIEDAKDASDAAEKEAKATIVTLPGGKEEIEKTEKREREEEMTTTVST